METEYVLSEFDFGTAFESRIVYEPEALFWTGYDAEFGLDY